jgi:hypothetical protein
MLQINGIAVVLLGGSLRVTGRGGSTSAPFDAGYPRVEDDTVVVPRTALRSTLMKPTTAASRPGRSGPLKRTFN